MVGGGIVGLATALALAAAGERVALLEREPPRRQRGRLGFDARTVALSPAAVDFLRALGGIEDAELAPIQAMRVWEYDGAGALNFAADEPLAWVVEHSALTTRLWRAATERPDGIEIFAPASVTAISPREDVVTLGGQGADGGALTIGAPLVVAADGADSRLRALTGVAMRRERPLRHGPQRAIATIARTRQPHQGMAWQRFGATGPVALLPLTDSHAVAVIWSTAEGVSQGLQALDDDAFRAALNAEVEAVTGGFEAVDRRFCFALQQTLAADFNPAPGVVLAGDAARTLHPLAGQGVNVGLEDARAIAATARAGGDWRGFAAKRRARSKLMLASMRGLLTAYCASGPWMRLARNTVIRGLDASPAIKAQLIQEAMGLGPLAVS